MRKTQTAGGREGVVREKEKEERLKEQELEFLECLPI